MNFSVFVLCFGDHLILVFDFRQLPCRYLLNFSHSLSTVVCASGMFHCLRHRNKFVHYLQWMTEFVFFLAMWSSCDLHDICEEFLPFRFWLIRHLQQYVHIQSFTLQKTHQVSLLLRHNEVLQGIVVDIGISIFVRAFFKMSLNSSSSGLMKEIPRNLLALSSFGFSIVHFSFSLRFDASDICFHIIWPHIVGSWGRFCFLIRFFPDRAHPSGGFSIKKMNLVKPVHACDKSLSPSTFQWSSTCLCDITSKVVSVVLVTSMIFSGIGNHSSVGTYSLTRGVPHDEGKWNFLRSVNEISWDRPKITCWLHHQTMMSLVVGLMWTTHFTRHIFSLSHNDARGSRLQFGVRSAHFTWSYASSSCAHVVCLNLRDSPFLFLLSTFTLIVFFIHLVFSFFHDVEYKYPVHSRWWGPWHPCRVRSSHRLWAQRPPHLGDHWIIHPGILRREQVPELAWPGIRWLHHRHGALFTTVHPGARRWCEP